MTLEGRKREGELASAASSSICIIVTFSVRICVQAPRALRSKDALPKATGDTLRVDRLSILGANLGLGSPSPQARGPKATRRTRSSLRRSASRIQQAELLVVEPHPKGSPVALFRNAAARCRIPSAARQSLSVACEGPRAGAAANRCRSSDQGRPRSRRPSGVAARIEQPRGSVERGRCNSYLETGR